MQTLVQISDTHLSDLYGFFYENFCRTAEAINALGPDLVINSGDLSLNGPDRPEDLVFAKWCHKKINAPVQFLPGNHDVGEEPGAEDLRQPVTATRLRAYKDIYGSDRWVHELGAWTLIGLNSQLFNTRFEEENEQAKWLEEQLQAAHGPVGVFLHKPLFLTAKDEAPAPLFTAAPAVVPYLNRLFAQADVRFIASGHLHQERKRAFDGVDHHWCPTTSSLSSHLQEGSDSRFGFLQYAFEGNDHQVTFHPLPDLYPHTFAEILGQGRYKSLKEVPPQRVEWR